MGFVEVLEEQRQKGESSCITICIRVTIRGGIKAECPGMMGSINLESRTINPVRCVCSCHNEDSQNLNEEQHQWFNERTAPPRGQPFRRCPEVVIGLNRLEPLS